MRGIGNENLLARVAALLQQGADQQNAGELAVGAGGRLERHGVHAGDLRKRRLDARHYLHATLREGFRLIRMRPRQTFGACHQFVDPRVVLHGAGAQRVHAVIDGVIPGGEAREVPDGLHFADFGEAFNFPADVVGAERFGRVHRRNIEVRKLIGHFAG